MEDARESEEPIVQGGKGSPIKLEFLSGDTSGDVGVVITGGDIDRGERVEVSPSGDSPIGLKIISHSGSLLRVIVNNSGAIRRSEAAGRDLGDPVFVIDIVAAGGGN